MILRPCSVALDTSRLPITGLPMTDAGPGASRVFCPPDGRPIDRAFAAFLADEDLHNENPCITYSMHSWYDTPEEWSGFEADLDRYANRPQWWYCHQNEYGAYRAQYRAAAQGTIETNGSLLRYRFQRPSLLDLNDPIPLTFEITGVEPASVTSIECPGTRIERTKAPEGTVRFHIHCPARSSLPIQIDHVATDTGDSVASADFPAISGVLKCDGGVLILRLENAGPIPIQIERVAYRIPLRFGPGVVFRAGRELTAGQSYLDQLNLGRRSQRSPVSGGQLLLCRPGRLRARAKIGTRLFHDP